MPRAVFGGTLAARWGVLCMDRPAYPAVMGDDPRSASGADTADATPAALRGPQRGMACDCTGAESSNARALGWAGTRTKHAKTKMRI